MNKRQEQKLKTRKHIVDVAFNQFSKYGLTTTRTADIAVAANLSHGSIFSHFSTREILLEEVIGEFGKRVTKRLHESVEENCGIKEILETHLKCLSEYEDFYIRLLQETSLLHESAQNSLIGIQSAISFHLIKVAEREMDDGKIIRMPLHLMFNTWNGLISYYLINRKLFAPSGSVILRYGKELLEHYMNLISFREEGK